MTGKAGQTGHATRSVEATPEHKWEFGTTQHPDAEDEKFVYSTNNTLSSSAGPSTDQVSDQPTAVGHSVPRSSAAEFVPAAELASRPPLTQRPSDGDAFTVKNYGFGFGRRGVPATHGAGMGRAEDQAFWREREGPPPGAAGRARRGSYAGANGFGDRGFERGFRGRGRGRGYRGYAGRGYGTNPYAAAVRYQQRAYQQQRAAYSKLVRYGAYSPNARGGYRGAQRHHHNGRRW